MSPKFHKHKLLLDEGLFPKKSLPRINNRHDVKHIKHDFRRGGISDVEVYALAAKQKRIIVTYNSKDFKKLVKEGKNAGVVGVSTGLTPDQLDSKLNALLSKKSSKNLYGRYISLGDKNYK